MKIIGHNRHCMMDDVKNRVEHLAFCVHTSNKAEASEYLTPAGGSFSKISMISLAEKSVCVRTKGPNHRGKHNKKHNRKNCQGIFTGFECKFWLQWKKSTLSLSPGRWCAAECAQGGENTCKQTKPIKRFSANFLVSYKVKISYSDSPWR